MTTSLKKTLLAALVVPTIALAAACTSGASDDKAATATAGDSGGTATAPSAAAPEDSLLDSASQSRQSALTYEANGAGGTSEDPGAKADPSGSAQTQAIISRGQISLRSKDIDKTRFELQKVLDALNGTISDEQSTANKSGRTIRQRLELRVPSGKFGQAMDEISGLKPGVLVSRNRSSQDVTTEVIDNRTRVRTQQASLARIQALLAQAKSLRDVISIEAQLSSRQADLDSLEAQQKYLADQTSLSTINVYLTVPSKKSGGEDDGHDFFSGLSSGWDHLGSSTNALLTGLGAVLPFAAVLALVGVPAWAAWRRRSPKPAAEAAPAA